MPRSFLPHEFAALCAVLPPFTSLGVFGPFLVATMGPQLPEKPWPASVAGLPFFVRDNLFQMPWKLGRGGNARKYVLEDLDARDTSNLSLYQAVIGYFDNENIDITRVMWFVGCWRITLSEHVDGPTLPGKICQTTAFYLHEDDDSVHANEAASRLKDPKVLYDDTDYSTLRPGVLLASQQFSSTSGVLVRGSPNERFMTVSSHSFPEGDSVVYQSRPQGIEVGQVIHRIGGTDIALVRLESGVSFENQTFQSQQLPTGMNLQGIRNPFEMRRFDLITMDNPFVGTVDGQFVAVELRRSPVDASNSGENRLWVSQGWGWFGQDFARLPVNGCCGTAIFDQDGHVVCFFRFYSDADHMGIGPAAQELVNGGYTLY